MKRIWVLLLLLISSGSSADMYFGVGFGTTNYDFENYDSTAIKYVLGNRISDNFAFEVGFVNFGDSWDWDEFYELSTESVTISAKLLVEPAEKFEAYVQVGAHAWEAIDTDGTDTYKDDDQDLFYGAGIRYEVGSGVYAGIEHTTYELNDQDLVEVNGFIFEFEF